MALEKCPKCGKNSFIKTPVARMMRDSWGSIIHVADVHYWQCLDKKCKHKTEKIRVNTKMGDHFEKPWYKRIF